MPGNIVENIVFFLCLFSDFGGSGAHSGAILESDLKKTSKSQKSHPLFGRLFGVVLLRNQILEHLRGLYFLADF